MTKKQKCIKNIAKNKRNKVLNRYYKSTIKTSLKILLSIYKKNQENKEFISIITFFEALKVYFSILDKSVKKSIIHINNAANKKSKVVKLLNSF